MFEETGLRATEIKMISPLLFSSPGMSDESNAMVVCYVDSDDGFTQENCEESECFQGHCLLDKNQAIELLGKRKDHKDNYLSVYTAFALLYFISDLWQ
ncbi:MAG: hypothetical protein ACI4WG_02580 [Erysipelotrichaceae bacterium]